MLPVLTLRAFTFSILGLAYLTKATPVTSGTESKSIYYLTNCFLNTTTPTQDAEIDYYTSVPKSFPTSKPKLISVLSPTDSIDYEDGTVKTPPGSPFNLTVVIGEDAYTAKAGTVVGSASGNSVKGKLDCTRLTRVVLYQFGETKCYSDYACE